MYVWIKPLIDDSIQSAGGRMPPLQNKTSETIFKPKANNLLNSGGAPVPFSAWHRLYMLTNIVGIEVLVCFTPLIRSFRRSQKNTTATAREVTK